MKITPLSDKALGMTSAVTAYVLWGILPLYWKQIHDVPAGEILAHRIVWSFFFMMSILLVTGRVKSFWGEFTGIIARPGKFTGIIMTSLLISVNWYTYIWAVNNNRVIETSLGYYINPLISVLLGIVVLKERLTLWQSLSFVLAALGVLNLTMHFGNLPVVAVVLALSFSLYGLFKKMVNMGAIFTTTLETLLVSPVALIYLLQIHRGGNGALGPDAPLVSGLLIGGGIVTAVPLILFAGSANRLPLSIMGFLQYIAPTMALFMGIYLFHEPFTRVHLVTFGLIWAALAIFSLAKVKFMLRLEDFICRRKTAGYGKG